MAEAILKALIEKYGRLLPMMSFSKDWEWKLQVQMENKEDAKLFNIVKFKTG